MASLTQQWECINKCPSFETVGTPSFCPHCASKELYPLREKTMRYDKRDFIFTNDGEQSSER